MATIDKYSTKTGTMYRARVRRKGEHPQVATFEKLSDARKWGQMIEGSITAVRRYAHLSEAHTAGVVARMNAAIFGQ